jgi:orotidine-5'-phosphate decarboxylase
MTKPYTTTAERIIVALDYDNAEEAESIIKDLSGTGITLKIGNQLGTYIGWQAAVQMAREAGLKIFCDTKFKDIPETVKNSARSITRHQPDIFNIMADNTPTALRGAVEGVESAMNDFSLASKPLLIGVTVLTSISEAECLELYGADTQTKVMQFAKNSAQAGLDGLVCSAQEASMLRKDETTKELLLITPGIRPVWATTDDQSRIMTPRAAIDSGADYLVIGRPVTRPPESIGSPRVAIEKILEEIA